MKIIKVLAVAAAAFFIAPALAQNIGTISNHAVPVGKGIGTQGVTSVAPSTAGMPLISNGASSDPSFQDITRTGVVATGTWQATVVAAGFGGTGQSTYTIGDLLQASASGTLSKLNSVATGNVLISGGVGVVSSWGKVGLTTHVSGTLPKANGGLGATTLSSAMDTEFSSTQGSVLYRNVSAWVALGPGTSGQLLSTGGPAANPSWITASGTGTVTNIASGNGLTGGPITATGTLAIDFTRANTWTGNQTFNAHILSTGPAPTPSGAGCSLASSSSDNAGILTAANGASNTCTITFGTAYAVTPACVFTGNDVVGNFYPYVTAKSNSAYTITFGGASGATHDVTYVCVGRT